ncbi:diguanylate cyclase [bacterium]|nr:diguanylate cyclase [bacterium]
MENRKIKESDQKVFLSEVEKYLVGSGAPGLVSAWDKLKPFFNDNFEKIFMLGKTSHGKLIEPMDLMKIYELIDSLRGNLELNELLDQIVKIVNKQLGFDVVILSLLNRETGQFEKKAQSGLPEKVFEQASKQKISQTQFNKLLDSEYRVSRSYFIPDGDTNFFEDYGYLSVKPKGADTGDSWHSGDILIIPLYSDKGEIFGFFTVSEPVNGKRLEKHTILMLEIFARQAHKEIENAQDYANVKRELNRFSTLFKVGTLVTESTDIDKTIQEVADIIKDETGVQWVAFFFKDDQSDSLYIKAQSGLDSTRCKGLKLDIGNEGGLVGAAAAAGSFRVSNDLGSYSKNFIKMSDETRSELAVPIKSKRALIGVLYVESSETKAFTQSMIQFFRLVANRFGMACENIEIMEKLENDLTLHTSIYDLGNIVNSILNLDRLLRKSIELMRERFEYWRISIFLFSENRKKLVLRAVTGTDSEEWEPLELEVGKEGIAGIVANTGKFLNIGDVRKFPLFIRGAKGTLSELAVALKRYNEILGVLDIESPKLNHFSDFDVKVAHLFSNQISIAIVNAKLYERERELAIRDGLTGLYNYRHFREQLRKEFDRAKNFGRYFTYLMIDIDGFKKYNDAYGHSAGDEVLQKLSEVLKENSRENIDTVARYGGEEFVIILPEVSKQKGLEIAERYRRNVEAYNFTPTEADKAKPLTISIGVATYPEDGDDQSVIIKKADKALYKAKRRGKNTVGVSE